MQLFISQVLCVFLTTVLLPHQSLSQFVGTYDCPSPWIPSGDRCYKFEKFEESIQDAKETCEEDGASLVSVNSFDENEFITYWLTQNDRQGREWFTSGRRNTITDRFFWESDGTEVSGLQFWQNEEARKGTGDMIVYHTDGAKWGWKVASSDNKRPFICEISKGELYKIVQEERGYDYGLDEQDQSTWEIGPRYYIQPQDVLFDTASTIKYVFMECAAEGNPDPSYKWYKKIGDTHQLIDPRTEARFTITNGKLIVNRPKDTQDNGQYECVASNRYGSVLSNMATLAFGYLNDFPKSTRDPVTANAYTGVGIECNPPKHSYPTISYSWYKDNIMNFIRPALKPYIFVSSDGKLYFSSVTKDDAGEYFCLVTRPHADNTVQGGKQSMPIRLDVKQSIGSEQEPSIVNGFPKVFPSSPKVGDNLRIECIAFGTAQTGNLEYSWSRENGALPGDSIQEDHNRVLVIPDVQLMDAGTYKCSVSRQTGQTDTNTVQVSIEAAPFFTIPLKNQHVDHGSELNWRCIGDGLPTVTYQWYLNATKMADAIREMKPEDQARFKVNKNVLTITEVLPQHAGMYQCSASNSRGTRYSSAQLRVLSFAPRFNKFPLQPNQYATLDGKVTIICQPEAAPYPDKVWYKNNRLMSPSTSTTDRVHVLPNGNLFISSVENSDAGTYRCEATNLNGKATSSGNLTVLDTTTVSNPPRDVVVRVNRTTIFDCEASFNPTMDITYDWWHNQYHIEFIKLKNLGNTMYKYIEPYYERGTGINSGGLVIRHTQFFHAGEYKCIIRSASYEIIRKATLQVIGPPSEPAGVYSPDVSEKDEEKELPGTSLVLSWWPGADNGQPIHSYVVEGKNTYVDYWERLKSNIPHPTGITQARVSTVVEGLTPYSTYVFRVRATNSIGEGEPSAASPQYTTGSATPVKAVRNVGGGGGKVGDLTITWDLLPPQDHNGPDLGYKIQWKKTGMIDEEWEQAEVSDVFLREKGMGGRYVHLVGSDNFYLPYDVRVTPYNSMGDGPASDKVEIMSAENIPSTTPKNVQAVYYNSTAITVEWEPVLNTRENMKGVLIGYRINYWIKDIETENMALFRFVAGQRDSGLIIGLHPNTFYTVNVQAINSAGNGPKSEIYTTRTLRAAPLEAPQEVQVSPINYDTIHVKWRGVSTEIDEEPLEGYKVRYFQRGENIYVATDVDAGKKSHLTIGGFQSSTVYELRVFGYSRGGDGLQSSPTLEFVLGPNCYVIEDSPDKEYVYLCDSATSLQISFTLMAALWSIYHLFSCQS